MNNDKNIESKGKPTLFNLLKPYRGMIIALVFFALFSNALNLLLPKIISQAIDSFTYGNLVLKSIIIEFSAAAFFIFFFTYLQSIIQVHVSERVARDLRQRVVNKISGKSFIYIQEATPAKLLTNLTSDVDYVKMFVSQAIVSLFSSVFVIIGASILLLSIDWKLALAVLVIVPLIGFHFFRISKKVHLLFKKRQEVIDWLNKVINESILGSALIRVINSQQLEADKFLAANIQAKDLGLKVLRLFASLLPVISFLASLATLAILVLGGHFVITSEMTIGNFTAFYSYLTILIFPIIIIGFMSNIISQAAASYGRIAEVLAAKDQPEPGMTEAKLRGDIELDNVSVNYGETCVLKNVSFILKNGTKTAIIGPTASGKTQLLYLLTALIKPDQGNVKFDGRELDMYEKSSLHSQIGFVFQDSIIFNMSLRENIAFSDKATDESLAKAIATAELKEFIDGLPQGLDTIVSERGGSLSGGQKQRIMLARALALDPKILLLDDFTARVDTRTEKKILSNLAKNYPGLTLLSVTQKISSVEHFDKIILLMEGEVLAEGVHEQLLKTSPEYVQIYKSQQSTNQYELQRK